MNLITVISSLQALFSNILPNIIYQLCVHPQANILNYQHGWHIVILAYNQHSRGTSVYAYGTPGVGESFVGTEKSEASKEGRLFINVFKKYAASKNLYQ